MRNTLSGNESGVTDQGFEVEGIFGPKGQENLAQEGCKLYRGEFRGHQENFASVQKDRISDLTSGSCSIEASRDRPHSSLFLLGESSSVVRKLLKNSTTVR
jgi:hypothetical protein